MSPFQKQTHTGQKGTPKKARMAVLFSWQLKKGLFNTISCIFLDFLHQLDTIKLRAVDQSTIQFLTIFGVLLTKTSYYLRRATNTIVQQTIYCSILMSTKKFAWIHFNFCELYDISYFSQSLFMKMHLHQKKKKKSLH